MSDQLTATVSPVSISARVQIDSTVQVRTPFIGHPGAFESRLLSTRRDGDQKTRPLEFSLDQLQGICEREALRTGEYTVEIHLSAQSQYAAARLLDRNLRISGAIHQAAINLTFRATDPDDQMNARERAFELADELIDAFHAARLLM